MADIRIANTKIAVSVESVDGTYEEAVTTDFISPLEGFSMTPSKTLLDRTNITGGLNKLSAMQGGKSVAGALSVDFKAGSMDGAAPEYSQLLKSAFGSERTFVTKTATEDGDTFHTDKIIVLTDGDAANYKVGDIITTERAGAFHTSPIAAVDETVGANSITLLIADPAGIYIDGIVIKAGYSAVLADTAHQPLSISYFNDGRLEKAMGCKITSLALENFTTEGLPALNFGFEGVDFDVLATSGAQDTITASAVYDSVRPPVILGVCVYVDGLMVDVSDVAISLENGLNFKKGMCSKTGKSNGSITDRNISGSFTPYKDNAQFNIFDKFNSGSEISIFAAAAVPTVDGEYENVCSFYIPKAVIETFDNGDQDGIAQESIGFKAGAGSDGLSSPLVITYN